MAQRKSGRHEPWCSTLGELLQVRREAEGLSRKEMAAELHISRPYLAKLECGVQKHPSPIILSRVSERLSISADDLYALAGYLPVTELPAFAPYLRAKHPDWPRLVIAELDDFYNFLRHKYSL